MPNNAIKVIVEVEKIDFVKYNLCKTSLNGDEYI